MIKKYGCTKCQTTHYDFENIYTPHLTHQSKHGIGNVSGEGKLNLSSVSHITASADRWDIGITIHFKDGRELSFYQSDAWGSDTKTLVEHTVEGEG